MFVVWLPPTVTVLSAGEWEQVSAHECKWVHMSASECESRWAWVHVSARWVRVQVSTCAGECECMWVRVHVSASAGECRWVRVQVSASASECECKWVWVQVSPSARECKMSVCAGECTCVQVQVRAHECIWVRAPPPPPVDPDDVNTLTRKIFNLSLTQILHVRRYPPEVTGTLLLKIDTIRGLEQLRSQQNDTRIPQIFKMQYLRDFKFYCKYL